MTGPGEQRHYSGDEFAQYFLQLLPDAEAAALELHLAGCDQCVLLARREYAVAGCSGTGLPEAHALALANESLHRGLFGMAATIGEAARRPFLSWVEAQADRWTAAVRVVKREAGLAATLLGPAPLGPDAAPAHGGGYLSAFTGALLLPGGAGVPDAEVSPAGTEGLWVRLPATGPDERPPVLLIVPIEEPGKAWRLEFTFHPRSSMWSARIARVPGDCVVALIPNFEP